VSGTDGGQGGAAGDCWLLLSLSLSLYLSIQSLLLSLSLSLGRGGVLSGGAEASTVGRRGAALLGD